MKSYIDYFNQAGIIDYERHWMIKRKLVGSNAMYKTLVNPEFLAVA